MVEHPTGAGLFAAVLQPGSEVVREQISLHSEETESVSLRLVEGNGAPVERDDTMQSLGNRVQEGLLGQVRNDGIVDLKQDAVLLFTFTQRRFRLFPLRDVLGKRHDKSRHASSPRNQRNVVVDPPQGAIFASILFLDLKLLSLSL